MIKPQLIIITIFLIFSYQLLAQETDNKRNYLTYGCGIGLADGSGLVGGGLALQLGYKEDLWNDRLHLSPNLLIGAYRSNGFGGIEDTREQYFNSVSLRLSVDYNIIQYKAIGLNIETGGLINTTRGLKGTGGEFSIDHSDYVEEWYYGMIIAGGIRIAPQKSNYVVYLMPLNLHYGNNYFAEIHALIRLEYRLK